MIERKKIKIVMVDLEVDQEAQEKIKKINIKESKNNKEAIKIKIEKKVKIEKEIKKEVENIAVIVIEVDPKRKIKAKKGEIDFISFYQ